MAHLQAGAPQMVAFQRDILVKSVIESLALSPNGGFLLTGDSQGNVVVWQVASVERIFRDDLRFHGQVQSAKWLGFRENGKVSNNYFAVGTADGNLHVYEKTAEQPLFHKLCTKNAHVGEVECIDFDPFYERLVSVGGGSPILWKVTLRGGADGVLTSLLSAEERDATERPGNPAKVVSFCEKGSAVSVSYTTTHEVHIFNTSPFNLRNFQAVATQIGYAAFDHNSASVFIFNLLSGVDEYIHPHYTHRHLFQFPVPDQALPLGVCVAHNGDWVGVGGEYGFARLINRRTQAIQNLDHDNQTAHVQQIAAADTLEGTIIATAETGPSGAGRTYCVKIWKEVHPRPRTAVQRLKDVEDPAGFFAQMIFFFGCGFIAWSLMNGGLATDVMKRISAPGVKLFERETATVVIHEALKEHSITHTVVQEIQVTKVLTAPPKIIIVTTTLSEASLSVQTVSTREEVTEPNADSPGNSLSLQVVFTQDSAKSVVTETPVANVGLVEA